MKKIYVSILGVIILLSSRLGAQDISTLKDSAQIKALRETFCSTVNGYIDKTDKAWNEGFAKAIYVDLQVRNHDYRRAEYFLRKKFPKAPMRQLDHALDSLIVNSAFPDCSTLNNVLIKDFKGLLQYVDFMRIHPVRSEFLPIEVDGFTDNRFVWCIENQNYDSLSMLFANPMLLDKVNPQLKKLGKSLVGKSIKEGIQFEKPGMDSSHVEVITFLWNGTKPMGQVRLRFLPHDFYGKIEAIEYVEADKVKLPKAVSKN